MFHFQSKNFRQAKFRQSRTKSSPSKLGQSKPSVPPVFGVISPPPAVPAANDDDIYMKVKALRQSVQEVNAIIETERSVKSEKSSGGGSKKVPAATNGRRHSSSTDSAQRQSTKTTGSAKKGDVGDQQLTSSGNQRPDNEEQTSDRSSNFKAILTRFNNIGSSAVAQVKDAPNFPRQRSKFYLKKDETAESDART